MRATDHQITFTDLEFQSQGIELDPVLEEILQFVIKNAALVESVRQQLDLGLKKPQTGRGGLTAEQTILSLILMRIKNWDYRELAERIADGYTLRLFTQFYVSFRQACVIAKAENCYGFLHDRRDPQWQEEVWKEIKNVSLNGDHRSKDASRFQMNSGESRPGISLHWA